MISQINKVLLCWGAVDLKERQHEVRGHSITTWTRLEGVKKYLGFFPRSGYKNCPHRGCEGGVSGQKMAKFCPRSC